jgi:predicted TIM-barrel fold metal-dependent hydrolase
MQRAYLAWLGGLRERYPAVRIVFAMLAGGAPIHHERLIHRGVDVRGSLDPNTLFDTASYGRRAIELCIETFGVERVVYGSDTPVIDSAPTLRAVRDLGDSVACLLQSDNSERLLGNTRPVDRKPPETS